MVSSKQSGRFQPVWWSVQHTTVWEECLPELHSDFQRRAGAERREEVAAVGPDDTVVQWHPTTPRNISVDRAHAVPDENWEVGTVWEQIEPALRFGVGARVQYASFETWNDELEGLLGKEWAVAGSPGAWGKVKRAVRRGFEAAHRRSIRARP
jgi:hypothetical protein